MKRSELKSIIREAIEEVMSETSNEDALGQKFFLAVYNHIKKNGQKQTHRTDMGWSGDTWTLGDVRVSDWNRHYSKEVRAPNVQASMAGNGKMLYMNGSLNDLKDLLVSISEQKLH